MLAAGAFVGYLHPGGLTWTSNFTFSPSAIYQNFLTQFSQLNETYHRPKIFIIVLNTFVFETAVFLFFVLKERSSKKRAYAIGFLRTNPFATAGVLCWLIVYLIFALFDYADEVYPNLRSNLGGGQPQITNLVLTGKKPEMAAFSKAGLVAPESICCGGLDDETVEIRDIAIWYQSDKFLYIANAAHPMKSRVIAIDLKLVRSIHYLPKHVRVSSGARIYRLDWNPS